MQEILVRFDWIRHGLSCANILPGSSKLDIFSRSNFAPDAALTDCGIKQAQETGKYFIDNLHVDQPYNIIVCSQLRRAIETALNLFNMYNDQDRPIIINKIYVVPYICEEGMPYLLPNADNESEEENVVMEKLRESYPNIKNILDWTIFNLESFNNKEKPNYDIFIKNVVPVLLNHVIKEQLLNNRNKLTSDIVNRMDKVEATTNFTKRQEKNITKDSTNIRIGCVSHSIFMQNHFKKHFGKKFNKPKNTQILSELITYQRGSINSNNITTELYNIPTNKPFTNLSTNNSSKSKPENNGIFCQYDSNKQPNVNNIQLSENKYGLVYLDSGFDDPSNSLTFENFKQNELNYDRCSVGAKNIIGKKSNINKLQSLNKIDPITNLSDMPALPQKNKLVLLPKLEKTPVIENKNMTLFKYTDLPKDNLHPKENKNLKITILTFNEGEATNKSFKGCIEKIVATLEEHAPTIICILSQEAPEDSFHKALAKYFSIPSQNYTLLTRGVFGQNLLIPMPLRASLYLKKEISNHYNIDNIDPIKCIFFNDCFSTEFKHKSNNNCNIKLNIKYIALRVGFLQHIAATKHAIGINLEINDPVYKSKIMLVNTHLPFGGDSDTPKNRQEKLEQIIESSNNGFDLMNKFKDGYAIFISGDLNFRNHCENDKDPKCINNVIEIYQDEKILKKQKLETLKNELYEWLEKKSQNFLSNELYKKLAESIYIDFPTCRYVDKKFDVTQLKFSCINNKCEFEPKLLDYDKIRIPSTCDQILVAYKEKLIKINLLPIDSCDMNYSDHLGLIGTYEIIYDDYNSTSTHMNDTIYANDVNINKREPPFTI